MVPLTPSTSRTAHSSYRRTPGLRRLLVADGRRERVGEVVEGAKGVLTAVHHVHEPVLVALLLVDGAHEADLRREGVVDEDEDRLVLRDRDPLPDHVDELADRQIHRDEVLALVD